MPHIGKSLKLRPSKLVVLVIAVTVVFASTLGALTFVTWLHQPSLHTGGYVIEDPIVNEYFTSQPGAVTVTPAIHNMLVTYSKVGMTFYGNSSAEYVRITKDVAADTVAVSFNMKSVFRYDYGTALVRTSFDLGNGDRCSATVEPGRYGVNITFTSSIGGQDDIQMADYFHDRSDRVDVLFQAKNGALLVEVNGVESAFQIPLPDGFHARLGAVDISENTDFPLMSPVTMTNLQLGNGTRAHYLDGLHKTILPDGKDFAYTLHMHADRAYPAQMMEMANLSKEYGIVGTYDAWWNGSVYQYGMESANYVAALHALQDAGWDIGIHAGGYSTMTRERVIAAIENLTAEFGPIPNWSDHGTVRQDLSQQGTNASSPYYTEDLIKEIGAAWWNNGSHSNSLLYDLNTDGMNYDVEGFEDIPTFRISEGYGHDMIMEQGRQADTGSYLRAWAYDRSVFVVHDYFAYYFYANTTDGKFSVFPDHDGIDQYPWSTLNPKQVFTSDQWLPLPRFQAFLNMTRDYNVWSPTVREASDRSTIVQQVTVEESATEVRITNPTSQALNGFTLFTRSEPTYSLVDAGHTLSAKKGAVDSWAFVMDLQPGEVLILKKQTDQSTDRAVVLEAAHGSALAMPNYVMRPTDEWS